MIQIKTKASFEIIKNNLLRKCDFIILKRGRRTTFIVAENKQIAYYQDGISNDIIDKKADASQIMKSVRSSVTKYISKYAKDRLPKVERLHPVVYSNRELWHNLPDGTKFFLIDASHCYWRIAFVMGCIGKTLYNKYAEDKDYKVLRLIALSILTIRIKREYYINGTFAYEKEEPTDNYRVVYQNIRHYAYNNSGQVKEAIKDYCIGYRVDGIFLLPEGLRKAKTIFKKNSLLYKVTKCVKVDDKNYSTEDGEMKKIV